MRVCSCLFFLVCWWSVLFCVVLMCLGVLFGMDCAMLSDVCVFVCGCVCVYFKLFVRCMWIVAWWWMACCFRLRVFVCLCLSSFLCVLFVIYCVVLYGLCLCVVCVCVCFLFKEACVVCD